MLPLDDEAERLEHEDDLCTSQGVLSPKEIRGIRSVWPVSEFAQVTGLGEATLNRWENGIKIQTPNDRYLRLLALPLNISKGLDNAIRCE